MNQFPPRVERGFYFAKERVKPGLIVLLSERKNSEAVEIDSEVGSKEI